MQVAAKIHRAEARNVVKIEVDLSSLNPRVPAHFGVTDNISRHGARIFTSAPCRPDDRFNVRSLKGNFRCRARVIYCAPASDGLWVVGLQLHACTGEWILPA
jgi:hypothetical protein